MKKFSTFQRTTTLLYKYSALELVRNKLGVILIFAIPLIFLLIVEWTSGDLLIQIKAFFRDSTFLFLCTQREVSIVFMSAAVSGFLTSYYSILLFHQDFEYFRYCVSMGLPPRTFLVSRYSFFLTVVSILAVFITIIVGVMIPLPNPAMTLLGFIILGIIYGAYGGIVGILSKDYMVAIMMVVLLANLDAGWLQNPVFYTSAQETEIIRWLPAHFPCQFVFSTVFISKCNIWALEMGGLYALLLLLMLYILISFKMRLLYRG